MEEQRDYIEKRVQKNFVLRQVFRLISRTVAWMGILLLVFLLIFQIPGVQNWMIRKVTTAISQKTETTVRLDNAYLSFFDHLVIKKVYIEDYNCDTLLFAGKLEVDFNLNPFVLIRKGLVVEKIGLTDALVKIQKVEGETASNLETFAQKLLASDSEEEQRPQDTARQSFSLGLEELTLNKVKFLKNDEIWGSKLEMVLNSGIFLFNDLNLPDKIVDIQTMDINGLSMRSENHPSKPLPAGSYVEYINEGPADVVVGDTTKFKLLVHQIDLTNSSFSLHDFEKAPVKTTPESALDFKHLEVFDIAIRIDSFEFQDMNFMGHINCISAKTSSGFQLNEFSVREASVTPTRTTLNGLKIITPDSEIGDTLVFRYHQYPDFKEFVDEVRINAKINESFVALKDIMAFAPALEENIFFNNNRNTILKIEGIVNGQINSLSARNLDIILPDGSKIAGNFGSRNLAVRTQEMIDLRLTELRTTVRTLRQLIPDFRPPETFGRLGHLYFTGSFYGFFADFVAFGDLRTDIGRAKMDMQMNLLQGMDKASYRGKLSLFNFNLGTWTQNPDLGLVNFSSKVENGSGLTAETANADLQANIESFYFKNYNYQNAILTGKLNQNFFNGDFIIKDENIDFAFGGEIDMKGEIPAYNFKASVRKLALKPLNLSGQDITLSGDLDLNLKNKKLEDLTGKAIVKNFVILRDDTRYDINSIVAESSADIEGKKTFILLSEVLGCKVEGNFKIDQLPNIFVGYMAGNFPGFAGRMNIKPPKKEVQQADFNFELNIIDSRGLNWLADEKLGILKDIRIDGFLSGVTKRASFNLVSPGFSYGNIALGETTLTFNGQDSLAQIDLEVFNIYSKDKQVLPTLNFGGKLRPDTLGFKISFAADSPAFFDNLALQGVIFLADTAHYGLTLLQDNLMIFESPWLINPRNRIIFKKNELAISNFELNNEDKFVKLSSLGSKGANVKISNLDFSYIDEIWDYDRLDFGGKYDLNVNIQDIFKQESISASVRSDAFYINDDYFGQLELDLFAKNLRGRANAHLEIAKDDSRLNVDGFYNIMSATASQKIPEEQKAQYFDFNLTVENYPLNFAGYFVAPEVKDITGSFDVNFAMKGMFPKPDISGQIIAKNGAFTVDYLKTRYTFDHSEIIAKPFLFDATGTVIHDKFGNTATIKGGISHRYLNELGVSATLTTDRFLALDTKKEDNSLFYGTAIGKGEVLFNGRFSQVDLYVNASVNDQTHIVVPVTSDREATELNSIRFVNKHEDQEEISGFVTRESPEGISVEMDLSVRENAIMELIFDEQLGDIIRGQGRGNIRMLVPRGGAFQMFGDYTIERGNYLFTFWNVINKDFSVREGGTILWNGDPFAAKINLVAEYKNLTVTPLNFIKEYIIPGSELEAEAYKRTEVELTLLLQGELLKPDINFDIRFPNLTSQLQTFADSKLRLLKGDQNELNRQVFGLIVMGQFFPSDFSSANVLGNTAGNTLSEFLSNQFSLLINHLFSEASEENKIFSNTQFDFVYKTQNQNAITSGQTNGTTANQDIQLSITKKFLDDRLSIQVGGNVDIGNDVYGVPDESGAFVGDDIVIEYILNKSRSLKLKIYQKLEPDISGGRRFQVGTGLSYRREFNSFGDFFESFKKASQQIDN